MPSPNLILVGSPAAPAKGQEDFLGLPCRLGLAQK